MQPNRLVSWVAVTLALATPGCMDGLLSVDPPDRVPAEELEDPRNAQLLVNSAIADFECAFSDYITAAGLLGDELADGQGDNRLWDYDRRTVNPAGTPVYAVSTCDNTYPGVYQTLQTARFTADNAIRLLQSQEFVTALDTITRRRYLATAAAYSGYGHLLLGEAMCFAAVDGGPELTSQQMLQLAEEKFTLAIDTGRTIVPSMSDIVNMARVGRARARLDLSMDSAVLLPDADSVPPGFQKNAQYSAATDRSSNRVWRMNNNLARVTVEDSFRMVTHMGVTDPRVLVIDGGEAVNSRVRWWVQLKYRGRASPIPIARRAEAQLIIAEVRGGATAVNIINSLHAPHGLPTFSASDPDSILRHVIEERRLELFLESHHFHDKLRFNARLEPDPLPDTHPEGAPFINGGTYGPTKCLPLPEVERLNNPNIP